MANFETRGNILLVWGSDVYRRDFHQVLAALPNSPVTLNSHDIWVIHYTSPQPPANATGEGNAATRLKKFVNMEKDIATTPTVNSVKDYMGTFFHEIGHYWLVYPFEIRMNDTAPYSPVVSADGFINAFFNMQPLPPLNLLARQNAHWSCFLSSGVSFMDGVNWVEEERTPLEGNTREGEEYDNVIRRYRTDPAQRIGTTVGTLGMVEMDKPFNDLELFIMGVIPPGDAYRANSGVFYELAPQFISPIEAMGGICLVFAPDNIITFGFHGGHEKIKIQGTGMNFPEEVDITRFYRPDELMNFDSHIAFRIIRRGNDYHFQLRKEFTHPGCLGTILSRIGILRPSIPIDVTADADTIGPVQTNIQLSSETWQTVKTMTINQTPVAAGYLAKTWGGTPPMVDYHFSDFSVKAGSNIRRVSTIETGEINGSYMSMLTDNFIFHKPADGPQLHRSRGLANLILGATVPNGSGGQREVGNHDYWTGVDKAPKLLTRIPDSDFVVGGKIKLNRSAMAPHAGGAVLNRKLWGFRRPRKVSNIRLPQDAISRQRDAENLKCAFMITAPDRASITEDMINNLELLRQATGPFYASALDNRRTITTTL